MVLPEKDYWTMPAIGEDTHFGFREVPLEDKQGLVDNVVRSSDINRRTYNGFEATMQARLPKGGTLVSVA